MSLANIYGADLLSCLSVKGGPAGPTGPTGPQGPAGVIGIQKYAMPAGSYSITTGDPTFTFPFQDIVFSNGATATQYSGTPGEIEIATSGTFCISSVCALTYTGGNTALGPARSYNLETHVNGSVVTRSTVTLWGSSIGFNQSTTYQELSAGDVVTVVSLPPSAGLGGPVVFGVNSTRLTLSRIF